MRALKTLLGMVGVACMAAGGVLAGFAFVLFNAEPVQPREAAPVTAAGGITFTPTTTPPRDRVIEVVDRIGPAAWKVGEAAGWLDSWTASRMKVVKACSGKAYRCVTFRAGKLPKRAGAAVGWSQGSTITIDTTLAKRRGYTAADRRWLLAHELGHQFGLKHAGGKHLMNPYEGRGALKLTSGQKKTLGKR